MDLPTFGGHPRRGALREVILEIITRKISRPGSRKWRREFLSKAFRKCFQMPRRVTHVPEHLSHLWTCTPGPPHFRWTPQTRGASRSDGENSSSGKSRNPSLASGGEGFFPRHFGNASKCHDMSPMCPNTCVTYVVGMDPKSFANSDSASRKTLSGSSSHRAIFIAFARS